MFLCQKEDLEPEGKLSEFLLSQINNVYILLELKFIWTVTKTNSQFYALNVSAKKVKNVVRSEIVTDR